MDDTEHKAVDADRPVSERIRNRLKRGKRRFNANDNIAEAIAPGELDLLQEEVAAKMRGVLESLVIDIENDHNTQDTARRVAKMYLNEVFQGRYRPAPPVTEFPNVTGLSELYRTRFPGHAVALCGAPEVGVEACGAGVEGAAETVLLDQPLGVVAGDEVADGLADLVDGLEDAAVDDLLFQRPEQPLDDAVIRHVGSGVAMSCRS
jgi:hypothetical protein